MASGEKTEASLTSGETQPAPAGSLPLPSSPALSLPAASSPGKTPHDDPGAQKAQHSWFDRTEYLTDALSDFINPILIKEARQALKSRQFAMIFFGVLICCWAWSTLGTAMLGPEINTQSPGLWIFRGYYAILSLPLIVVVPFSAFRGLTSEREDKTFELIQITTLKPRQAVMGKIVAACVQILIFVSATAPCMAFTYMLRGIDIMTITGSVLAIVAASLLLTAHAVFMGTLSAERHYNTALSVVLAAGYFAAWWFVIITMFSGISDLAMMWQTSEFTGIISSFVVLWLAYFALFLVWAAARLTFVSDNRSTAVRWVLHLHPCMLMGWFLGMYFGFVRNNSVSFSDFSPGMAAVFSLIVSIHWSFFGSLLIGESSEISERVKRTLPNTFLGKTLFTWFNPGPYTAYVFIVANMVGYAFILLSMFVVGGMFDPSTGTAPWLEFNDAICFVVSIFSYVTIFLGLSLILTQWLRRFSPESGPLLSFVLTILLLVASFGIPLSIQYSQIPPEEDWTTLQIANPFWTLYEIGNDGNGAAELWYIPTACLFITGVIVFALNLPGIEREIHYVRAAKPKRVEQDDAELEPAHPQTLSPWDNEGPMSSGPSSSGNQAVARSSLAPLPEGEA